MKNNASAIEIVRSRIISLT